VLQSAIKTRNFPRARLLYLSCIPPSPPFVVPLQALRNPAVEGETIGPAERADKSRDERVARIHSLVDSSI